MKQRIAWWVSTVGGAGLSPVAPGTAGSLVGALLFLGVAQFPWWTVLLILLVVMILGVAAARETLRQTGVEDDPRIVVDELLGMWVTLFAFPVSWLWIVGFFLFRFFDIVKIFPANRVDRRMHGARGVILDDLISGVYAHVVLRILQHFWSRL